MQRIHLETILPTDADQVWAAMQYPTTFLYVCRGLFGMPALAGRSTPMRVGERGTGWLFAFHLIPAYRHTLEVRSIDEQTRTITTHEHGGVLRTWNHTLHVEALGDSTCRYSDTVDIDAGPLTPIMVRIARGIYRYRHRRWHKLVAKHLSADRVS